MSTESKIDLAADIVLLIGYPARIISKSFNSENVAVHNRQLAPPAPDKIEDIFPSNILRVILTVTLPSCIGAGAGPSDMFKLLHSRISKTSADMLSV